MLKNDVCWEKNNMFCGPVPQWLEQIKKCDFPAGGCFNELSPLLSSGLYFAPPDLRFIPVRAAGRGNMGVSQYRV
jgi:hypothetical protein